jgi:hypothetical protein
MNNGNAYAQGEIDLRSGRMLYAPTVRTEAVASAAPPQYMGIKPRTLKAKATVLFLLVELLSPTTWAVSQLDTSSNAVAHAANAAGYFFVP